MQEEMLIVPTQELIFAVKKDGSIISNFSEKRGGVEQPNPKAFITFFHGLKHYIRNCPDNELMAYTIAELIESGAVHRIVMDRMENLKSNSNE